MINSKVTETIQNFKLDFAPSSDIKAYLSQIAALDSKFKKQSSDLQGLDS